MPQEIRPVRVKASNEVELDRRCGPFQNLTDRPAFGLAGLLPKQVESSPPHESSDLRGQLAFIHLLGKGAQQTKALELLVRVQAHRLGDLGGGPFPQHWAARPSGAAVEGPPASLDSHECKLLLKIRDIDKYLWIVAKERRAAST